MPRLLLPVLRPDGAEGLDLWFAWQLSRWLRQWRWAILLFAALLLVWIALTVINTGLAAAALSGYNGIPYTRYSMTQQIYYSYPVMSRPDWQFPVLLGSETVYLLDYSIAMLRFAFTLLLATSCVRALTELPDEVALAVPAEASYRRRLARARWAAYLLVFCFLPLPRLLMGIGCFLVSPYSRSIDWLQFWPNLIYKTLNVVAPVELLLLLSLHCSRVNLYVAAGICFCLALGCQLLVTQLPLLGLPAFVYATFWPQHLPSILILLTVALFCLPVSARPAAAH